MGHPIIRGSPVRYRIVSSFPLADGRTRKGDKTQIVNKIPILKDEIQ